MMDINRILVPIDFSHEARFALDWAIQLLRNKSNGSIFLYHVASSPPSYLNSPVNWDVDGLEKPDAPLKKYMKNWLERIPHHIHSDFLLSQSSITSDISNACKQYFIDLIVVVAREHHGLSRWIRHNTCENIVRGASCPVLVLHNKPFQRERVPALREEFAALLTPQL